MKTKLFHIALLAALALSVVSLPSAGYAAASCRSVGQQVAAQNGGKFVSATQANRGGQQVCVVVVLMPGSAGQHPRREEIVVPLN